MDDQRQLIQNRFEGKYGIQSVFYHIKRESDGRENHGDLLDLLAKLYADVYASQGTEPELPAEPVKGGEEAIIGAVEEAAAVSTPAMVSQRPFDPLDQQKGRWGGQSETRYRRLKAEDIKTYQSFCSFTLIVEPTGEAVPPVEGEVIFHLRQTFHPSTRIVRAEGGRARLDIRAYGAFTVGVETDGGSTWLELDLSQVDDFPPMV